jgi:23S rRNA (uracil1939-C5)-methyltransferase
VQYVLPGELVEVDPLRVLEASPDRVEPECVHFGVCGGCHYQHAAYPAQVAMKAEILRGLLRGIGLASLPEFGMYTAAEWGYRNRIRLRVEHGQVGYSRRGSNEFLPISMCPIAAKMLWRAAEALIAVGGKWLEAVAEVELFCTADESRLQMQFYLRGPGADAASFAGWCEKIKLYVPQLVGAGAELDPDLNRRARRRWAGVAWGAAGLNYTVAGRSYWVSRGAFFQVNLLLVDRLVELVCAEAEGALAWDLFAGVGLFTRALMERFGRVVAVEAGDVAAADLVAASRGGKLFEAVHSPTLDFLRVRELQRERPELIVLDPPRAGLGTEEAAEVLGRIGSARIVYVSCDPVTLARDLAVLVRAGYGIASVDMVDLFPQTFHLETVVKLRRTYNG